jgi:S-adenosylmethionine:tRNA ribosyltransferase-isomerase
MDKISVEKYTYYLPENKIAKYPLEKRENSNLLIYKNGGIQKDIFKNIPVYLPGDHLMVFNNAKVVSARLHFRKETGANIEIFCLEPYDPSDYSSAFRQTETGIWKCMVGNLKKWKSGVLTRKMTINQSNIKLQAEKIEKQDHHVLVKFTWDNPKITFGEILDTAGMVPIPPYLKRESEKMDKERYQTKYSKIQGSVAAPTAGLHFDSHTLKKLEEQGIQQDEVTLHVGAGTFRPIQTDTANDHEMHKEHFSVSLQTINNLLNYNGKILAVGTTTVRTLESLYWIGIKIKNGDFNSQQISLNQWDYKDIEGSLPVKDSLQSIKDYLLHSNQDYLDATTQIMIIPGYQFKLTNAMITNFHQPKSTLLMLIAAFVGDDWEEIYDFALKNDFRFLSYGDSSLLFPQK